MIYLGACWCWLRYLREGRPRWWWATLACYIFGIATKETIYLVPFALLIVAWYEHKFKEKAPIAIPFFVVGAVGFKLRLYWLGTLGIHPGTNHTWLGQWFENMVFGYPGTVLLDGYLLPLAILCVAGSIFLLFRRAFPQAIVLVGLAALCYWLTARFYATGFDDSIIYLFAQSEVWGKALELALITFLWARFLIRRRREQVFGWLLATIAYLPMMTTVTGVHALYFPGVGWSVWLAYAAVDVWQVVASLEPLGPYMKRLEALWPHESGALAAC